MSDHAVYPGGPGCNPNCPGEHSMYHDGYGDGFEMGERHAEAHSTAASPEYWDADCLQMDRTHMRLRHPLASIPAAASPSTDTSTALREALERIADGWDVKANATDATQPSTTGAFVAHHLRKCAAELRATLSATPQDTTE